MNDELTIRDVRPDDLAKLRDLYQHLIADDPICPSDEAAAILQRFLLYPGSS